MISGILIEGLIYGIMVLGVFMTFRVLNFCDMTVDGSFPLGACVLATCLTLHIHPVIALYLAFMAGACAGLITTVIYTKLRIPDLLAGILVMTMLYSVNLRVMRNQANVSLLRLDTPFKTVKNLGNRAAEIIAAKMGVTENVWLPNDWSLVFFMIIIAAVVCWILVWFFSTDFGLTMGALGSNPQMVVSQGVNPTIVRGVGICLGDGLAALSGAFWAMFQGFADVGSGTGVVVSGLASLMLGEFLIRSNKIGFQVLRVILGSILYRGLMYFGRRYGGIVGLGPNDLKLLTGLLIIICLIVSNTNIADYFKEHMKRPEKTGTGR